MDDTNRNPKWRELPDGQTHVWQTTYAAAFAAEVDRLVRSPDSFGLESVLRYDVSAIAKRARAIGWAAVRGMEA